MSGTDAPPLRVYIIAGEPSGDQLGALLMRALKERCGSQGVTFAGIGAERMTAEGLTSLVPIGDLAVMGFWEVLPNARKIAGHLKKTIKAITAFDPDVVITIDSWGFTGRIHKGLVKAGHKALRVHYVAPMVWMWKKGRAKKVAARVDHLLALWPFEPSLFKAFGLPTTHVGHAAMETRAGHGDAGAFRKRHKLTEDQEILAVLPGSRRREVKALMPVFRETVALLSEKQPGLQVVMPTLSYLRDRITEMTADWPVPVLVVDSMTEKDDAFAASRAALAASGTISIELALAGVPHIVAYKISRATEFLLRRLVLKGNRFVNMVNILLDRPVIPELLQDDANPKRLHDEMARLLDDGAARAKQIADMAEAVQKLAGPSPNPPSVTAAETILELLEARRCQRQPL